MCAYLICTSNVSVLMTREGLKKAKATAKPSTTAPSTKKRKHSEVASSKSGKGNQVADPSTRQPRVPRPALQVDRNDAKRWYHSFVPYERYISEMGINTTTLEQHFPTILDRIKELKLHHFLESPGPANLSMVKELYANWNFQKNESYVRGVWINLQAQALCDFLGALNHDPRIF